MLSTMKEYLPNTCMCHHTMYNANCKCIITVLPTQLKSIFTFSTSMPLIFVYLHIKACIVLLTSLNKLDCDVYTWTRNDEELRGITRNYEE